MAHRRKARGGPARAALAGALALAAGCGPEPAPPEARTLVLGYGSELQTLHPLVSTDQNANELIYSLLFTPLVTYDSTYTVRPWLARSWELSPTDVVFQLRDDVRWHDGEPVTAEDVKFTYDRAVDPRVASPLGSVYLGRVESAEVLGPHRIRFTFREPHAAPLENFFWPPVPRHRLADVPPEEIARGDFGRAPVGSGPYRLVSWDIGQGLEFRAVSAFPEELGGPARIERVAYRIIPEPATRLAQLRRGAIHLDGPIAPADAERARAMENVEVISFPWRQFTYVGWNTRRAPFREAEARRALAMAMDRGELLRAVARGRGRPASSVIPPWHPYDPGLEPLPHAPDSAAAVLERLGWIDADGDGVRERNGEELAFDLLASNSNPLLGDLAQVIQSQLAAVGVGVRVRLLEWQTVLGMHRERDFDAVLTNWVLDHFRVDPRALFHSSQVAIERSANRGSYADPEADSLMERGSTTLDDEEAAAIWRRFAEVLQEDQPVTLLFWNDELAAVRSELEGVRMDARGELVNLPNWRWARDLP
ncbi:MAG: ABC transporter substrate-binding protein [Gemmatimonadota bacterium]|nr:ABC transporter substrate-binding protein [Gemmatimonadota bacterium]